MDVWNSIKEDTTMIFQWESNSATAYLKQLFSDETIAKIREKNPNFQYIDLLSIGNGAIRPAGESYRDALSQGIYKDNGNKELNDFLASTLGYLVYQEQIIEFLHTFCGFSMGEADIVRRHFSKKTGTEDDIPIIKDGGYMLGKDGKPFNNHYIGGFINTMKEKFGVEKEDSEKIIVDFLQVIEDASAYLFSKNHADPYSWIGYICGYLRYHYPLEFITSALNIFETKEDKSMAIIEYAKRQGIKISPIRFRHSIAQYNFDKATKEIFKGISSIKFMNANVANEMYELRDNQYDSFIDLLYDLQEKTTLNSRQINILIELDFFEEFGDTNLLLAQYDLFSYFYGKKQLRKDYLDKIGVPYELVRACAEKESEKMFTKVDMHKFLVIAAKCLTPKRRTLKERIAAQVKHLGYIDIVDERYSGMMAVLDVNTKYAPRLKMHSLMNGNTIEVKIDKRTFNSNKLQVGDIIRVMSSREKPKLRRDENGEFVPIEGTLELWLQAYRKMEAI